MAIITQLPAAIDTDGSETIVLVQGGATKRAPLLAAMQPVRHQVAQQALADVAGYIEDFTQGPPGTSDNTYTSRALLRESPVNRRTASLVGDNFASDGRFNYETAGAPYADDDGITTLVPTGDVVGAWVRQRGSGIITRPRGPGAVARSLDATQDDFVMAAGRGAMLDGIADDTDAVQAAIDHCLSFPRARALRLTGRARITRPLVINRLVDTTESEFRIIAEGEGAGFYTTHPIEIFTTTLEKPDWAPQPLSEFVTCEGVHFEASSAALQAIVASPMFLRMKWLNCYFSKIKVVDSPIFLQSWYFDHCNFRDWMGRTVRSYGPLFDCNFLGCIWEHGEDGIESVIAGAYGLRIIGNLFEGARQFFKQAGGYGLTIHGNYTEANAQPDYIFTSQELLGAARGTSFVGNQMTVTHDDFNVQLGDIRSFASSGNYCSGKLFDMTGTPFGRLQSIGDYAEVAKFSRYASAGEVSASSSQTCEAAIAATPGGLLGARPLTFSVNIVSDVPEDGHGVGLPPTDDMRDTGSSRRIVVINAGAHILTVFSGVDDFTNFGTSLSWDVPPGTTRTFYQYGLGQMAAA